MAKRYSEKTRKPRGTVQSRAFAKKNSIKIKNAYSKLAVKKDRPIYCRHFICNSETL